MPSVWPEIHDSAAPSVHSDRPRHDDDDPAMGPSNRDSPSGRMRTPLPAGTDTELFIISVDGRNNNRGDEAYSVGDKNDFPNERMARRGARSPREFIKR